MKVRFTLLAAFVLGLLFPLQALASEPAAADAKPATNSVKADTAPGLGASGISEAEAQDAVSKATATKVRKGKNLRGVETYWGNENLKEVVKGAFITSRAGFLGFATGDIKNDTKGGFTFGAGFGYDAHDKWVSVEIDALMTFCQTDVVDASRRIKKDSVVKGDFMALRVPLMANIKYFTTKRVELFVSPLFGLFYNEQSIEKTKNALRMESKELKSAHKLDYYGGARLGVEYYTGLRHFSLGLDVEIDYIINAKAVAVGATPMLKYTF